MASPSKTKKMMSRIGFVCAVSFAALTAAPVPASAEPVTGAIETAILGAINTVSPSVATSLSNFLSQYRAASDKTQTSGKAGSGAVIESILRNSTTVDGVKVINPTAAVASTPGQARQFISSRPTSANEASQVTLPAAVPNQSIVLTNADAVRLPTETQQLSCQSQYGVPAAGMTYVGGPIVQKRTQTSPGVWTAWAYQSGQCLRRTEEFRNDTNCPGGQTGVMVQKRVYDLKDDNSVANDTGWVTQSQTCAVYFVNAASETQSISCPGGQTGTIIQSRTYDLWSDGSKRNYSPWAATTNTCAITVIGTNYEMKQLDCQTGYSGMIFQRRSYDQYSDGTKTNYSAWSEVSNTCVPTVVGKTSTTQTLACTPPATGTIVQSREYYYDTNGALSRWAGDWVTVNNNCVTVKFLFTSYETKAFQECPWYQKGAIWKQRTADVWTDGTEHNSTGWIFGANACYDYTKDTVAQDQTVPTACGDGTTGYILSSRTYSVQGDNSINGDTGWAQNTNTCFESGHKAVTRSFDCDNGLSGTRSQKREFDIVNHYIVNDTGWWDTANSCAVAPPVLNHYSYTRPIPCDLGFGGTQTQSLSFDAEVGPQIYHNFTDWVTTSSACTPPAGSNYASNGIETQTVACPAGYTGTINQSRQYFADASGTRANPGFWYETSRACTSTELSLVGWQIENRQLSCAAGETGTGATQKRGYNLWSDGTKTDYSIWYTTVASTCKGAPTKVTTLTETQQLYCSTGQTGTGAKQQRSYDLMSDGTKANYTSWTDTIASTCVTEPTVVGWIVENKNDACPANYTGLGQGWQRGYNLWTDGSKTEVLAWYQTTPSTCAPGKISTGSETQALACASGYTGTSGVQTRTYDLMADGSKINYSAWATTTPSVCTPVAAPLTTVSYALTENNVVSCLTIGAGHGSTTWTKQYDLMSDGSRNYKYGAGWTSYAGCTWM